MLAPADLHKMRERGKRVVLVLANKTMSTKSCSTDAEQCFGCARRPLPVDEADSFQGCGTPFSTYLVLVALGFFLALVNVKYGLQTLVVKPGFMQCVLETYDVHDLAGS